MTFMGRLDKTAILLAFVFFAWLSLPSSLFLREISTTVIGNQVTFVRELPLGPVTAEWQTEITLINEGGFECNSGAWQVAYYQQTPGNTVRYELQPWANACINAGPPFYITNTRRVLLFGLIPLRSSVTVTDIIQ